MSEGEAKTDCELLLSSVLPFAEKMLRKYGEFFHSVRR
jgi:hypothetical protein